MKRTLGICVLSITLLTGCANHEQTLSAAGGVACGVLASSLGRGNDAQRLMRGLLGGGACAVVGGAIGRALDERDRQRASEATMAVLRTPLPPNVYAAYASGRPPPPAPAVYYPPPGSKFATASSTPAATPPRTRATPSTPAESAPVPASSRMPGVPRAPGAQWVSEHSGASGNSVLIGVEPANAERGECRTVRETATTARGDTLSQTERFCESGSGVWERI